MKKNEKWHLLEITEYGVTRPLKIGKYHILHNPENPCTPYVAAYNYDPDTNEWAQGHYFTTLSRAMEYAVFNE